jgi:hypothetical protein
MKDFPGYRELETFLRDISLRDIDSRMRRMFSTNPDVMSQQSFKDAAREVLLMIVEESFSLEIRDRVEQEMTVLLDNLLRELWLDHSGMRRSEDSFFDVQEVVRKATDQESLLRRLEGVRENISQFETSAVSASLLSELDQLSDELSRGFESVRRATLDAVRRFANEVRSSEPDKRVHRQVQNVLLLVDAIDSLQ